MRALGAEPPGRERERCRLLREITDLADELDRRGELAHLPMAILGREFRSASLDHPAILPLLDELGVCLDIGPCPR
jgi:hypothetical protein